MKAWIERLYLSLAYRWCKASEYLDQDRPYLAAQWKAAADEYERRLIVMDINRRFSV